MGSRETALKNLEKAHPKRPEKTNVKHGVEVFVDRREVLPQFQGDMAAAMDWRQKILSEEAMGSATDINFKRMSLIDMARDEMFLRIRIFNHLQQQGLLLTDQFGKMVPHPLLPTFLAAGATIRKTMQVLGLERKTRKLLSLQEYINLAGERALAVDAPEASQDAPGTIIDHEPLPDVPEEK